MINKIKTQLKKTYYLSGVAMTMGMVSMSTQSFAGGGPGNNFSDISDNIGKSLSDVPGLISSVSYLVGSLLGVLGVMKIKDHVENPSQTPLKDGAIRLAAGGGLFAVPILLEAMLTTIGDQDTAVVTAGKVNKVDVLGAVANR